MRDHDEVIRNVLQRAEEIKREGEKGTAEKRKKESSTARNLSGKWIKRFSVVASCLVLIGAVWFVAAKLGDNKKPADKPDTVKITVSTPTISEEPPHGGKPIDGWYLTCENEMEREYNHGEVIEKRYKLVSMLELSGCKIVVGKCDGVEVVSTDVVAGTGESWTYVWNITIRIRVNDAVDPGNAEFSVVPTFVDQEQAERVGMKEQKQTIFASNIGQKDYVCLNVVDGLYDYSEKVRQHIDDLNRQGESVELH